jgi:HD-GYP domain-containing protein (c-di-GMP phosphodiesterase class II)
MLMIVNQARETKRLLEDKRVLEQQIKRQNDELRELNTGLEAKVKARTAEIEQTMLFVEKANDELKKSYITSVKVFSSLIEMREGSMAGHSRRIAELVRNIAVILKMSKDDAQDVFLAALLHDIGKIGLPDTMLKKPYAALNQEERELMHKHPAKGQTALLALESMAQVGVLIRCHHERYDGGGYPDGISGEAIPLGARILSVVNEYDGLISGTLQMRKYSLEEAMDEIRSGAGKRYDAEVVKAFVEAVGKAKLAARGAEIELRSGSLQPGMVLSRDIITRDGVLLLARDRMLDERIIGQIRHFEHVDGRPLPIFIRAQKK